MYCIYLLILLVMVLIVPLLVFDSCDFELIAGNPGIEVCASSSPFPNHGLFIICLSKLLSNLYNNNRTINFMLSIINLTNLTGRTA